MVDEKVAKIVKKFLQTLTSQGIPVRYGIVFGSQSRNTSHQWSDIDLLVVSPKYDGNYTREDVNFLWRVAARTDTRLEPIPVGERQYVEDDSNAIFEIARREGQMIPLAE